MWQQDKKWSDIFLPKIKMICGLYLTGEPPEEEDMERNTDLIVLNMMPLRIGCRIRRFSYFFKYKDDFTIRSDRPSKSKSELAKIIEGYGDYFFYGFSNHDETNLCAWKLCKFSVFRLWFMRKLAKGEKGFYTKHKNIDDSSEFYSFKWNDLPPEFIIKEDGYDR